MAVLGLLFGVFTLFSLAVMSKSESATDKQILEITKTKFLSLYRENGDYGYTKTKVTVKFDDGGEYICRLDLATNDATGFTSHAQCVIAHPEHYGSKASNYLKDYSFAA